MNTHWNLFKITTFWESHGNALWVVIDWLPANFKIDLENIAFELGRRKPGQSKITTQRKESDEDFEILSWIFEWYSTGHPITIIVKNQNQKSKDYDNIKDLFRPNHADLTYFLKYWIRDYRWGWRSSWRETLSRVIAGAIAKQYLKEKFWVEIFAFTSKVWTIKVQNVNYDFIEKNILRTACEKSSQDMIKYVEEIASKWNSVGWIIECHIKNPPVWLWEPVFWKIKSILASSMLSIGWVLGFEYWAWFDTVNLTWESYNEGFEKWFNASPPLTPLQNNTSPLAPLLTGEGDNKEELRQNVLQNYFETPEYIKDLVKKLRQESTSYEEKLWEFLRNRHFMWIKFRRQHPFWRYVADFYSNELKIVLELDWKIHENQVEYDKIRDETIEKYWVKVLRFKNKELEDIEEFLNKLQSIFSPLIKGEGQGVRYLNIHSPNNNYNWVLGWITTWEDVIFRIAVKPTSSIYSKQKTVDTSGNEVDFQISWRHDPCILPRVVPVVESMAAIDILDLILINNSRRF